MFSVGHVGVYYRVSETESGVVNTLISLMGCAVLFNILMILNLIQGGALLDSTSGPGFHLMVPFITSFQSVQVFD